MWEYKAIKLDVESKLFSGKQFNVALMERELNSLGKENWELVSFNDMTKMGHRLKYFMMILKRKK